MFEWLINLPVWVQTPVVVVCVLAACLVLASAFHALLWRVIRPTADEREIAGYGVDGSVLKKLLLMTDRDEVTSKERAAEDPAAAVAAEADADDSGVGQGISKAKADPSGLAEVEKNDQSTRRTH